MSQSVPPNAPSSGTTASPQSYTYPKPTALADQFMHLLTGDEWKVFDYAIRRINGFHRQQRRISLSQFCEGTTSSDGRVLDHGTGLSKPAVIDILKGLIAFGFLLLVADDAITDPQANGAHERGQCYAIQTNIGLIDRQALKERQAAKALVNQKRTVKARQRKAELPLLCPEVQEMPFTKVVSAIDDRMVSPTNHRLVSPIDQEAVSPTDQQRLVPLTSPLYKDGNKERKKEERKVVVETLTAPELEASQTNDEPFINPDPFPLPLPQPLDESARPYLEAFLQATDKTINWRIGMGRQDQMKIVQIVRLCMAKGHEPEAFQTFVDNFPRYLRKSPGARYDKPSLDQWLSKFDAVLAWQPESKPEPQHLPPGFNDPFDFDIDPAELGRQVNAIRSSGFLH